MPPLKPSVHFFSWFLKKSRPPYVTKQGVTVPSSLDFTDNSNIHLLPLRSVIVISWTLEFGGQYRSTFSGLASHCQIIILF
jgi:hypothetical protein